MRKLYLGLTLVLGTSFALAQAPPTTPPVTPPVAAPTTPAVAALTTDYFPLKERSKWVYKVGENEVTVVVGTTDKGETKLDTLANLKIVASETVMVKADGVYRTKINSTVIEPPVKILELEMKDGKLVPKAKGAKWAIASKVTTQPLSGDFMIGEPAKVTVPASPTPLDCVFVEGPKFNIAGTETSVKYYFAPGKGIVKLSYSIQGTEATLELKSYDEAK
jgi:hypothetical protein